MSQSTKEILIATGETLYLLLITGIFVVVIGVVIGFILYLTESNIEDNKSIPVKILHTTTAFIVDLARSIPFIILMIVLIPFTLLVMGTMLGAQAALPALIISAAPFYARLVYMSLKDVDNGKLEALQSMGANKKTIILSLTKEAMPSFIAGLTVTLVTLVGFIASAGAIGAGGLGDLAKKRAFSNNYLVAFICVVLVLVIVFTIQIIGNLIVRKIDRR